MYVTRAEYHIISLAKKSKKPKEINLKHQQQRIVISYGRTIETVGRCNLCNSVEVEECHVRLGQID